MCRPSGGKDYRNDSIDEVALSALFKDEDCHRTEKNDKNSELPNPPTQILANANIPSLGPSEDKPSSTSNLKSNENNAIGTVYKEIKKKIKNYFFLLKQKYQNLFSNN